MRNLIVTVVEFMYPSEFALLRRKLLLLNSRIKPQDKECYSTLIKFLIVGEDHRFRYHPGFDIIAIGRACISNVMGRREGASTIHQQLVRVLIDDYRQSFRRKIKEIVLAVAVQQLVPKAHIPLMYLKVAYFGNKVHGIDKLICQDYNNAGTNCLSDEAIAEIIARIKYPYSLKHGQLAKIEMRKRYLLQIYSERKMNTRNNLNEYYEKQTA